MWSSSIEAQAEYERAYAREKRRRERRQDVLVTELKGAATSKGFSAQESFIRSRGRPRELKLIVADAAGRPVLEWWPTADGLWYSPVTKEHGRCDGVDSVIELAAAPRSTGVRPQPQREA